MMFLSGMKQNVKCGKKNSRIIMVFSKYQELPSCFETKSEIERDIARIYTVFKKLKAESMDFSNFNMQTIPTNIPKNNCCFFTNMLSSPKILKGSGHKAEINVAILKTYK
jgi:hypothetical protein